MLIEIPRNPCVTVQILLPYFFGNHSCCFFFYHAFYNANVTFHYLNIYYKIAGVCKKILGEENQMTKSW